MKEHRFTKQSAIEAPVEDVFRWHARPGALERLSPPWDPVGVVRRTGGIEKGAVVTLKMHAGPVPYEWMAEHTDFEENRMFRDRQIKGPFSKWVHTHLFEPDGNGACVMEDRIDFALPFHPFGNMAAPLVLKELDRIFEYRHRTLELDMACHRLGKGASKILISGASGVIGSALIPFLTTGGHSVTKLVRRPPVSDGEVFWDPESGRLDLEQIRGVDTVIHLSGENIGQGRWTNKKKKRIIESRTKGTSLIAETVARLDPPPKTFVCASAIGYYGDRGGETLTEEAACGLDFISGVCDKWEKAASPAMSRGIRVVFLRIGIALSPLGGALQKMLPVFKAGMGGKFGNGGQYMSWIGIDDVIGAVSHVIENDDIVGEVNIVAPKPVTNSDFARTLGRVLSRPSVFPVPEQAINLAFGEMGREVLLAGAKVMPKKLLDTGYLFRNPDLEGALRHLLGRRL